jgi:anti-repressor protein
MYELIHIDTNQDGVQTVSARELYEKLGYNLAVWSRWAKTNIIDNQFAIEDQDYKGFNIVLNGNQTSDYALSIDFAKRLCMMARTEVGEQIRNYFIEVEKRHRVQVTIPQTPIEVLKLAIDQIAEQDRRQRELEARTNQVERTLTLVKDTIIQRDEDWRKYVNETLNRVAHAGFDGSDKFQKVKSLSYELLEERARCRLDVRLENLRSRLLDRGASRTKLNSLNRLDVIEEEPRLKEIYTSIVKELFMKYVA